MTTPHKSMLIQARDALAYTTDPDSPHYEDQLAAIAALTAAIDSPEPEPGPVAWIGVHVFDALKAGKCVTSTMTKHKAFEDDVQIFTRPPAVREPLSEDQIFDIAHANEALFDRLAIEYQSRYVIALFRAIEAALRAKP